MPLLAVRPQLTVQRAALLTAGTIAGFVLSAPYAIINWKAFLFAFVAFLFFGFQSTFFERNFCTIVLAVIMLCAMLFSSLRNRRLGALLVALTLGPMGFWSWQIATSPGAGETGRDRYAAANNLAIGASVWWIPLKVPACQGAIAVNDYSDDVTPKVVRLLTSNGYELVGRYRSRFALLPSSTLQTYLDTGAFFFRCKSADAVLY